MSTSVGLICHYGVGGSARVAVDLARELAARDHRVHLFARSAPFGAPPPERVTLHAIQQRPMTTALDSDWCTEDLAAFTQLVCDVVQREDLDLLHFHHAVPFVSVAQAVRSRLRARTPAIIGTLHGTDVSVFGHRVGARAAICRGLRDLEAVTTVSQSYSALATEVFGLDYPPQVIPNFVNLTNLRPRQTHRTRLRIAYVSNFREIKQPESMARIVEQTLRSVDADVWLVGDGERMPAVESILAERMSKGQVCKLGVRLDLDNILPFTDAILVTSRMESFSLVALEAMAAGVPVVAPRVGGVPELVEDGISGFLFAPGDEAGAARCLTRLLTQPALRSRMAAQARTRAGHFSAAVVIPQYEQLYRDVRFSPSEALPVAVHE
jgi:L-malate glycosyltransferase